MSRQDITRRPIERQDRIAEQRREDDNFYEAMPMAAAPIATQRIVERDTPQVNGTLLLLERVASYATSVVEAILGLRLILAAFSYFGVISTTSSFARFIYGITNPLVSPFSNLFNTSYDDPGLWAIGFAMLMYGLVGYAIVRLFRIGQPREY
jgi:hypothetical protein